VELGLPVFRAPGIAGLVEGNGAVIVASGDVLGDAAQDLALEIRHLDPAAHPVVTLDLRQATALDPLVVHALLHARQRRGDEWGRVRLLVAPGRVARFFSLPRLQRLFDVVVTGDESDAPGRTRFGGDWDTALVGSLEHYHQLLELARQGDLPALRRAAAAAHPICVGAGAEPGGPASGEWCRNCPVRHLYGGCQPLVDHVLRAAEQGNWEAAQLLILSLIAETTGVTGPGQPPVPAEEASRSE
jgi:anti-anti-sigma regulatory factor